MGFLYSIGILCSVEHFEFFECDLYTLLLSVLYLVKDFLPISMIKMFAFLYKLGDICRIKSC